MIKGINWEKKGKDQYIAEFGDFELIVVGSLWNVKYGFLVVCGGIEQSTYGAKEACVNACIEYATIHGIQLLDREGNKMGWIPMVCPICTEEGIEAFRESQKYDSDYLWCRCKIHPMEDVKKIEFDKNKILTLVTADQAKVGQKGWFDDTLIGLKNKVANSQPQRLIRVQSYVTFNAGFINESGLAWGLFYPCKGPMTRFLDKEEMNALVGKVVTYHGRNYLVSYFADRKEPLVYVDGLGLQTAEQLGKNFNINGVPILKDI